MCDVKTKYLDPTDPSFQTECDITNTTYCVGFIDIVSRTRVVGWAAEGKKEVKVEILIDNVSIGETVANIFRPDLKQSGYGDGCHGWVINLPTDLKSPVTAKSVSARITSSGYKLINNASKISSRGFIDKIENYSVSGWACDGGTEPVIVEILLDDAIICRTLADQYREDLDHLGYGDGRRGWTVCLPTHLWHKETSVSARIVSSGIFLENNAVMRASRLSMNFVNSIFLGKPKPDTDFTSREIESSDYMIAQEIIELARALPEYASAPGSIWDRHTNINQCEFASVLKEGDAEKLASFLVKLPAKRETTGFLQGKEAYLALSTTSPLGRSAAEGPAKDALLSLAQYIGVEQLETVEIGPFGEAILKDQRDLAKRIEDALGIPLAPPPVFDSLLGLVVDSGIVDRRAIQALYAAHRLRSIARKPDSRLCEIGGGIGFAAYYAICLGVRSYTIVDLPNMILFQYFFLRKALPSKGVSIVTSGSEEAVDINLVPASVYFRLDASWRWDATLNCDSFPEMGDQVCLRYFNEIKRRSTFLLSINQEGGCPLTPDPIGPLQTVVPELLKRDRDYSLLYRMRSWVRHGFGEELYQAGRS